MEGRPGLMAHRSQRSSTELEHRHGRRFHGGPTGTARLGPHRRVASVPRAIQFRVWSQRCAARLTRSSGRGRSAKNWFGTNYIWDRPSWPSNRRGRYQHHRGERNVYFSLPGLHDGNQALTSFGSVSRQTLVSQQTCPSLFAPADRRLARRSENSGDTAANRSATRP
jgi:hypothetical protein